MSRNKSLSSVVEPPEQPAAEVTQEHWAVLEQSLGFKFPADYREFIQIYGSGLLGSFLRVLCPIPSKHHQPYLRAITRILQNKLILRELEGEEEVPYKLFPLSPALLPWGTDENANEYFWLADRRPPSKWPVIVAGGRSSSWERFDMSMIDFLSECFLGRLRASVWPDDFPELPHDRIFEIEK